MEEGKRVKREPDLTPISYPLKVSTLQSESVTKRKRVPSVKDRMGVFRSKIEKRRKKEKNFLYSRLFLDYCELLRFHFTTIPNLTLG